MTVHEVSEILRIQRPKVYDLIKEGTIKAFKLGSDWRIPRESVERLVGPIPADFFLSEGASETKPAEGLKGKS